MIKLRSDSWSTLLVNNVDAMLSSKKKKFIIILLDNTSAGNENMLMIAFVHSESSYCIGVAYDAVLKTFIDAIHEHPYNMHAQVFI